MSGGSRPSRRAATCGVRIACGYDLAGVDLGASIACSGVCLTVVDKGDGLVRGRCLGRDAEPHRAGPVGRRRGAQPRARAQGRRRAWRPYRHRPCRRRSARSRRSSRSAIRSASASIAPPALAPLYRRQGLDRARRRLADRQRRRDAGRRRRRLQRQHHPAHRRADQLRRRSPPGGGSISRSTSSPAISAACSTLKPAQCDLLIAVSHCGVIRLPHEHTPDRSPLRHRLGRRDEPRRPRPRRRPPSQFAAQIGRCRLEPDRGHARQAREIPRQRRRAARWRAPSRSSTRRATAGCSSWSTTRTARMRATSIIPAQMATPDAINFMAKHGRGLICLALTKERVDQLGAAADEPHQRHPPRNRLHHLDRGPRGRHHRHLRRRPRAHRLGRDRRLKGPEDIVIAGPRLPAGRARRRRAGPRRPYRGGGRRLAPGRPQPVGRDLRDHDATTARWRGWTIWSPSPSSTASRSARSAT